MMRLDSASSSFLALLVIKSKKKWKKRILKETFTKPFFVAGVLSCKLSAQLKKFRGPVLIVKLTKGQKYSNILKYIANFNKILQKFVYKYLQNHFIVSRDYPVSLFQALNSFTGSLGSINLEQYDFSKNWKKINFIKKLPKFESINYW